MKELIGLVALTLLLSGCESFTKRVPVQFMSDNAMESANHSCSQTCFERGRIVHIAEPDRCICGDVVQRNY